MEKLGLYIHIPFCKKKCNYCDFISFFCDIPKIETYFECLLKEIENIQIENAEKKEISTIYIGGGTPSFPDSKYIVKILETIKKKFKLHENIEITIEINPGTVDKEKLIDYKKIGINRISIGLQCVQNRLLKLIGRIHTYEDFLSTYKMVKEVGFDNINIDLMLGLPTQTQDELIDGLNEVINLKPNHISIYSLIIESGTLIEKMINENVIQLPDEDIERKMYWKTKEILEKNGYNDYEISNFSIDGFESKHNLSCWNQDEYIGFGLAAHSYNNNKRFSNIECLENYIENIKNNEFEKNIVIQEKQTRETKAKEFMMIGLRKIDGVSISEFEKRFRINPLFYFRFEINRLTKQKLIEVDLDNIKLTTKGLDFANKVFEEFV